MTYSYFTEDELNIFDFTLKRQKTNSAVLDKIQFDTVLDNFKINGNKLLNSPKEKIKKKEFVFGNK